MGGVVGGRWGGQDYWIKSISDWPYLGPIPLVQVSRIMAGGLYEDYHIVNNRVLSYYLGSIRLMFITGVRQGYLSGILHQEKLATDLSRMLSIFGESPELWQGIMPSLLHWEQQPQALLGEIHLCWVSRIMTGGLCRVYCHKNNSGLILAGRPSIL